MKKSTSRAGESNRRRVSLSCDPKLNGIPRSTRAGSNSVTNRTGHFDRLKPSKTLETDLTKFSQDDITHVLASHVPTKPPELRLT